MSVLENLKAKVAPKVAPPGNPVQEISERLKTAEAELATLEMQFSEAALDAVLGGSDTAPINRRLSEIRETVSTLRAALIGAESREAAEIHRQRISLQQTQIKSMGQHFDKRNVAATKLVAAIQEMADQYKNLIQHSVKARDAGEAVGRAIGVRFPDDGSFSNPASLKALLAGEFYRVSATPGDQDGRSFPGSHFPHINLEWQPKAITALDEQIKKSSTAVMAMFKAPK